MRSCTASEEYRKLRARHPYPGCQNTPSSTRPPLGARGLGSRRETAEGRSDYHSAAPQEPPSRTPTGRCAGPVVADIQRLS